VPVSSIDATASDTLRDIPLSGVWATKIPPPGPFDARIRCPEDRSFSASRIVGRDTPKRAARSPSRPRKSPGTSPSRSTKCRIRAATRCDAPWTAPSKRG
jgi:hypothetical protein